MSVYHSLQIIPAGKRRLNAKVRRSSGIVLNLLKHAATSRQRTCVPGISLYCVGQRVRVAKREGREKVQIPGCQSTFASAVRDSDQRDGRGLSLRRLCGLLRSNLSLADGHEAAMISCRLCSRAFSPFLYKPDKLRTHISFYSCIAKASVTAARHARPEPGAAPAPAASDAAHLPRRPQTRRSRHHSGRAANPPCGY
jgi:hypothetical protein